METAQNHRIVEEEPRDLTEADLLDVDDGREDRWGAVLLEHGEEVGVVGDVGGAVDAQGLDHAGDEADESDVPVVEDVGEGVGELVAEAVGHDEGARVERADEARIVAAG